MHLERPLEHPIQYNYQMLHALCQWTDSLKCACPHIAITLGGRNTIIGIIPLFVIITIAGAGYSLSPSILGIAHSQDSGRPRNFENSALACPFEPEPRHLGKDIDYPLHHSSCSWGNTQEPSRIKALPYDSNGGQQQLACQQCWLLCYWSTL